MSTIGARLRNGRGAPLAQNPPGARGGPAAGPALDNTPYRLLWSTGIAAVVLGIAAFVLWGLHGAGTFFDMMAVFAVEDLVFCTSKRLGDQIMGSKNKPGCKSVSFIKSRLDEWVPIDHLLRRQTSHDCARGGNRKSYLADLA